MNDLVSVIMPSYNTAQYIAESINSVLSQTYQNWELIIVDDCSTDNTLYVLCQFDDKRIRIYRNDKNSGAAVTRNRAIKEAKGRWLAFLDSDDLWQPEKLEKQIRFMEQNGYAFSYTQYEQIDDNGVMLGNEVIGPLKVTRTLMQMYDWLGCLTVVYDAEKLGKFYSPDIRTRNDYAMWLQVVEKSSCYLLTENLAKYRKHSFGSISTVGIRKLIFAQYYLYRKGFGYSITKSLFRTSVNLVCGAYKKFSYVRKVS